MFHLAIPAKAILHSVDFYEWLGCGVGRKSDTFAIISFYGGQVVLHKSVDIPKHVTMYPRHFGHIFTTKQDLDYQWNKVRGSKYVWKEYFTRYEGKEEEHHSFFLKDPSNNLIEFKWYKNSETILG